MGNCIGISVEVDLPEEIEEIEMSIQNNEEESICSIKSLCSQDYDDIDRITNEILEEEYQRDVENFVDELLEEN